MTGKKTAIILFNLGGPDKQSSVKPFLFNLFNDRAIISLPQPFRFLLAKFISGKREKTAQEIYAQIGGKSPIFDLTKAQAENLEKELSFDGKNYKAFIAMRYWHPMSKEVAQKVAKYQPDQIIFLPLYPQFSATTTGSSFKEFEKELRKSGIQASANPNENEIPIKKVCCYFDDEDFILAHAKLVKKEIEKQKFKKLTQFRILFSAHGLPQKIIDAGDPCVFQVEATVEKVMAKLFELLVKGKSFGLKSDFEDEENAEEAAKKITKEIAKKISFQTCYQSKVGPLKWTTPSLGDEIKRAAADKKSVVITPIAFVSEHSETLVELDIEYRELADELGIKKYGRVPALNIDGHFIKSLAKICRFAEGKKAGIFSGCGKSGRCPSKQYWCNSSF